MNCSGEDAGVGTVTGVETQAAALIWQIDTPYRLPGLAGSTRVLVWRFYDVGLETLSRQGALPGGSGACRNSGGEPKERLLDLEET